LSPCYQHLAAEERGVIMAMKSQGQSGRAIARVLGRAQSTIARELHRNGYRDPSAAVLGRPRRPYDAVRAGERARRLRRQPRAPCKLPAGGTLWQEVRTLLACRFSPQQVAGTLKALYPHRPDRQVSHETIYTAIYATPRGTLRRELIALLRQHKCARRPRGQGANRRGRLPDLPSIHERPAEADARQVPGHWEGDLITGARNRSAVGVLIDRTTLFVMLVRLEGRSAVEALSGFRRAFLTIPRELRKTLTYDQGKEMAHHRQLARETGLSIYFADPSSPWQRGICENTNGLLREYLPKGTDLSGHSQADLDAMAWSLNTRPRKTLNFHMPAEVFFEHCRRPDLAKAVWDDLRRYLDAVRP